MTPPRGNLLALALTRAFSFGTGLILSLIVARMGPVQMGAHGWLLALASVAGILGSWGMSLSLVPLVARDPTRAPAFLRAALRALAWTTPLASLTMLVWAISRSEGLLVPIALATLIMVVEAHNQVVASVLHGLRRMDLETPAMLTGRGLTLLLAGLVWRLNAGLAGIFAAVLVGSAVTAIQLQRVRPTGPPAADDPTALAILRDASPFAANIAFATVYLAADLLMLHELRSPEEVGWYRLASLFVLQLPLVAEILTRTAYPLLAQLREDLDALQEQTAQIARLLLASSIPVCIGGIVLAEPLLVALGGSEAFLPAVTPLRVLLLMLPLRFVNATLGTLLSATQRQPERVRIAAIAAALNLLLNAVAIPVYGIVGAALTTLATDAVAFLLFATAARTVLPTTTIGLSAARALVPALLMGAVLTLVSAQALAVQLAVGALVVIPALRLSGAWLPSDLRRLAIA